MTAATAIEVGADVALGALLLWPIRRSLADLARVVPVRYRLASLAILLLPAGGQLIDRREATFPVSDWGMHTESMTGDPRFIEYTAVLEDGREARLLIGTLLPVAGKRLRTRMDQTVYGDAFQSPMDGTAPVEAGDEVLVHGSEIRVPYGQKIVLTRNATVTRANALRRAMTKLAARFELTELYEVSFSSGRKL